MKRFKEPFKGTGKFVFNSFLEKPCGCHIYHVFYVPFFSSMTKSHSVKIIHPFLHRSKPDLTAEGFNLLHNVLVGKRIQPYINFTDYTNQRPFFISFWYGTKLLFGSL